MATYKGTDGSGRHLWEIYGQTFTDSVSTIGGSPVVGKPYPALANHPDSRGHWVILVSQESKILPKLSVLEVAGWTHFMAGPGRSARSPWNGLDLRRYGIIANLYGGASTVGLVRAMDNFVFADMFGGYVVKLAFGATQSVLGAWGGGVPTDMVIHQPSNSLFVFDGSTMTRLNIGTMAELWSSSLPNVPSKPWAATPYSIFVNSEAGVVGVLGTRTHDRWPVTVAYMTTWGIESGLLVASAELQQTEIPNFPGDPTTAPYVSGKPHGGIQAWDKICQWLKPGDPSWESPEYPYDYPEYQAGEGSQMGKHFSPFGRIDDASETTWTPPAVYPGDIQELTSSTALRWGWGGTPGDPEEEPNYFTLARSIESVVCMGNLIIPKGRNTPTFCGYNSSGGRVFEVNGWDNPAQPPRHHLRKFFTPLMATQDRVLVIARHVTFFDVSIECQRVLIHVGDIVYDERWAERPPMYRTYEEVASVTNHWNSRVALKFEDFFEIYDTTGNLKSASRLTTEKITSMVHFVDGPAPGTLSGVVVEPFPGYEEYEVNYPAYPEATEGREDWYPLPWLTPSHGAIFDNQLDDWGGELPPIMFLPLGADGESNWVVFNEGIGGMAQRGHDKLDHFKQACLEMQSQVDCPLLYDKYKPVLNSDKSRVIFPPKLWGDTNFDAEFNFRIPKARRTWDAAFEDQFLEDVVLGADYRKRDCQWIYAFDWPTMSFAWRHQISYTPGATVRVGIPGCGGGKCYIPYRLNSQSRIRVLDDKTGAQLADFVPSGSQVGTIDANTQIILAGDISLMVTASGVMGIYPNP